MPLQRSGAFTAFAVLNFIIGGLLLVCAVCSGVDWTVTVNNQDVTEQLKAFLNLEIPNYSVYKIGGAIMAFVLGLGLIASGVGLLHMQNWARVLAIVCCIIGILHHGAEIYLQLVLVNPALERFFGRFPFISFFPKFVNLVGVVVLSAGAVYFLIQAIVLPLSSARISVPDYYDEDERPPSRGRRWDTDDVYEDERPRRRRRIENSDDEGYEEDEPPRRRPR
jgi:hypothetical protein